MTNLKDRIRDVFDSYSENNVLEDAVKEILETGEGRLLDEICEEIKDYFDDEIKQAVR